MYNDIYIYTRVIYYVKSSVNFSISNVSNYEQVNTITVRCSIHKISHHADYPAQCPRGYARNILSPILEATYNGIALG